MDQAIVIPPRYACVVAADAARGIGRGNDLPWPRLPGDLAHFKQITSATRDPARRNAVVMGRKTWDSVPPKYRPLPDRINIVVSRTPRPLDGATAVASLDLAISFAQEAGAESIFLVGGGQLFALAVADPRCEVLYYTDIAATFETDTTFPPFHDGFALDAQDPPRTDAGITYSIQRWLRRDV